MNINQRSVLDMSLVTIDYLNGVDPAVLAGIPMFSVHYDPFSDNVDLLNAELGLQLRDRKGYAIGKKDDRQQMVAFGDEISDKLVALAVNTNDSVLEQEMSFTISDLNRMSDTECLAANQSIFDVAQVNLAALAPYGVTTAMMASYKDLIVLFGSVITNPKSQSIERKMATEEIKDLFAENSVYLTKMDKLVLVLKQSNPDFVNQYYASRKLVKPSYRVLAARILVVDEQEQPIENVLVVNKDIGLKRRTTNRGQILLKQMEDGVYVLNLSKSDYVLQNVNIPITRGERTEVKVVMKLIAAEPEV